jgi:hypothetical protein
MMVDSIYDRLSRLDEALRACSPYILMASSAMIAVASFVAIKQIRAHDSGKDCDEKERLARVEGRAQLERWNQRTRYPYDDDESWQEFRGRR